MHAGVLGTGDVGKALGKGFVTLGHDVKIGSREAKNEKALAWAREMGAKASVGTFADAASFGEIVVLATLGVVNERVLKMAGPEKLRGKVVIDATNPLDFSGGMPPKLAVTGDDSAAERPRARTTISTTGFPLRALADWLSFIFHIVFAPSPGQVVAAEIAWLRTGGQSTLTKRCGRRTAILRWGPVWYHSPSRLACSGPAS